MDNTDTLSMEDDNDSTTAMYDDDDLMTPDISGSQLAEVINVRDASEAVFAIPEIMSNIYQFLDRKKDLLSCTLLCKAGFPVAAKEMFREMRKTDFAKICETDCSFDTLNNYAKLVETIHMPGANTGVGQRLLDGDVQRIIDRYPNLKCVTWSPTIQERHYALSEVVLSLPSDVLWNDRSAVLSLAVPSINSRVLKETLERGRHICVRVATDRIPYSFWRGLPVGTPCVEYISIDLWQDLEFLSEDRYQQLRRLCISLWDDDLGPDGLLSLKLLPQLQDLTITTADRSLKWLALLPNTARMRVTVKLACPAEDLLAIVQRDHPRIEHLELDCIFPETQYCQYRVVRFLGLVAKRTTINIPLVCERTHVEKLFCLREALKLQEAEEYLKRPPFETFVTLMPKETSTIKEEPTDL